jgi:hypothetical protein
MKQTYDSSLPENFGNHMHVYNGEWEKWGCSQCALQDQNVRTKQDALLSAAISHGLPKHYPRDLFITCEQIVRNQQATSFAVLLRDCGVEFAPEALGPGNQDALEYASSVHYWVNGNDAQVYLLWRPKLDGYGWSDHGYLEVVTNEEFVAWLDAQIAAVKAPMYTEVANG